MKYTAKVKVSRTYKVTVDAPSRELAEDLIAESELDDMSYSEINDLGVELVEGTLDEYHIKFNKYAEL